jgi:general secretion pathway protein G
MNRMRQRLNTRASAGFTLIELLIVIVILGILAAIAIFAVGKFQSDAKTACSKANDRINQTTYAASQAGGSGGAYTTSSVNTTC